MTDRSRGRALAVWAVTGFFALLLVPSAVALVTLVNPPPPTPGRTPPALGSVLLGLVIINTAWVALGTGLLAALRLHRRFTVVADADRRVCVVRSRLFGFTRHRVEVPLDEARWGVGAVHISVPAAASSIGVVWVVLGLLTGPIGIIVLLLKLFVFPRPEGAAPSRAVEGVRLTLWDHDAERVRIVTGDEQTATAFLTAWDGLCGR